MTANWHSENCKNTQQKQSGLGEILGAIALVGRQEGLTTAVTSGCHRYIRAGDASRIPALHELLAFYGDLPLAED